MGRFLDMMPKEQVAGRTDAWKYEKNELYEESHAAVPCEAKHATYAWDISLNSFISYSRISASEGAFPTYSESDDVASLALKGPSRAAYADQNAATNKTNYTKKGCGPEGAADATAGIGPFEGGEQEEQAAIVEHDAGVPRDWAAGFARLHPDRPIGDVPRKRWLQFVDDIGRFLDSGWAVKAAALGWGPLELFGCDRTKPFTRIDQQGLLWLICGRKLVALTEDTAVIETFTGPRLTYRRRSSDSNAVLVWELLA